MAKAKTKTTSRIKDDCVIPTRPPPGALRSTLIETSPYEERQVIDYFEWQSSKDPKGPAKVEHLELVKSEAVWGRVHKVWDVHATDARWWVITEPTNLYSQELFPSLDYTLSFHIGLMARVAARSQSKPGVERMEEWPWPQPGARGGRAARGLARPGEPRISKPAGMAGGRV